MCTRNSKNVIGQKSTQCRACDWGEQPSHNLLRRGGAISKEGHETDRAV